MFTGIIKALGSIDEMTPRGGDLRLSIRADGLPWSEFEVGESIAVNGVCLTAVELFVDGFATDVSRETMQVTALAALRRGSRVNLEPSLALNERLGGHLVSGHVDCVGEVVQRATEARSIRLEIELPDEFRRYVARKGSVCIDGVSLTVNSVTGRRFGVNIIPHTAAATIIDEYRVGQRVNIEVDLVMRYLERLVGATESGNIDLEVLKANGYG